MLYGMGSPGQIHKLCRVLCTEHLDIWQFHHICDFWEIIFNISVNQKAKFSHDSHMEFPNWSKTGKIITGTFVSSLIPFGGTGGFG